ncbi:MAG TPA: hypothetical protein VIN08_01220 [Ohtaekwangia sp.]|uniref:hypothetical protein n=1 Tax=Ohtaekwangia sp. TaxID=2066019 RepID=UPI002F92F608
MKNIVKPRRIEFEGDHKHDSLLIGNFGDVEFTAKGSFELSGMIYSKKDVEFTIIGNGIIRFHGVCRKITIHLVKGDCTLDFSKLTSKEVCCVSLRDNSRTIVGPTKIISRANLQDKAVLKYSGNPRLQSYSIAGMSRIELLEDVA